MYMQVDGRNLTIMMTRWQQKGTQGRGGEGRRGEPSQAEAHILLWVYLPMANRTVQYSTAQHSTAQHSTAQHSAYLRPRNPSFPMRRFFGADPFLPAPNGTVQYVVPHAGGWVAACCLCSVCTARGGLDWFTKYIGLAHDSVRRLKSEMRLQ
jgi:hypothetical protein